MADRYPSAVTHVGLTVTDLDHAIRWYREIFGFQVLIGPVDLAGDESHARKLGRAGCPASVRGAAPDLGAQVGSRRALAGGRSGALRSRARA